MTEVIVKLAPKARPEAILAKAAQLDIALRPLHGATGDAELDSYLVGRVRAAAAAGVIEQLLRCDGVDGAYVKPAGAPPEGSDDDVARS